MKQQKATPSSTKIGARRRQGEASQDWLVPYLQYAMPDVAKVSPSGVQLLQLLIEDVGGSAKSAKRPSRH